MTVVTFERVNSNKKVAAMLRAGFTHTGTFDYVDRSLAKLGPMGFGVQVEGWHKNDGQSRVMTFEQWEAQNQ